MRKSRTISEVAIIKEGVAYIPLWHKGECFTLLVDEADLVIVGGFAWCVANHAGHIGRKQKDETGKPRTVYIHRQILDAPAGVDVDHINGNPLDNRRANLRLAPRWQNAAHRTKLGRRNRTGVIGVCERKGRFIATIQANGTYHYLGSYAALGEARAARKEAERELLGEFAPAVNEPAVTVVAA